MKHKWKDPKPFKHQVQAIKGMLKKGWGGALLFDPRCGKTRTTIEYASILVKQGKIKKMVVVCPAVVRDVWVEEFGKWSDVLTHFTVWDAAARSKGLEVAPGPYDLRVVIVNYDAFSTPGPRTKSGARSQTRGRFKNRALIRKWIGDDDCLGVLDESHKIKSPSGKSAVMIVSMSAYFKYRVILTGTVVTKAKRSHDIQMQWKYLNPERFADLGTSEDFKNRYGRWITANGYPQWVGQRNMDELRERIAEDAFIVKREDCFDLPPRDVQVVKVPLSPKTARVYDEMAEEMITHWAEEESEQQRLSILAQRYLDAWGNEDGKHYQDNRYLIKSRSLVEAAKVHTIEASIKLVQTLRLAQISGGVVTTDEGEIIRIGTEKLDRLQELIENAAEYDEKMVIAARFKPDLNSIAALGRRLGLPVFELRGGISRDVTSENIRQFRKLVGCGLFVMQPQAGSLGIDLSTASRMVWYSLTTSYVDWTQACDRIALSRNSTTFTYLLGEGTYDEVLYEALQSDKELAAYVTAKPERLRLRR